MVNNQHLKFKSEFKLSLTIILAAITVDENSYEWYKIPDEEYVN